MKFSEMPYKRVELADVEAGYKDIIARTKAATSGEEQFAIHRDYYKFLQILRRISYWRRRATILIQQTPFTRKKMTITMK